MSSLRETSLLIMATRHIPLGINQLFLPSLLFSGGGVGYWQRGWLWELWVSFFSGGVWNDTMKAGKDYYCCRIFINWYVFYWLFLILKTPLGLILPPPFRHTTPFKIQFRSPHRILVYRSCLTITLLRPPTRGNVILLCHLGRNGRFRFP